MALIASVFDQLLVGPQTEKRGQVATHVGSSQPIRSRRHYKE